MGLAEEDDLVGQPVLSTSNGHGMGMQVCEGAIRATLFWTLIDRNGSQMINSKLYKFHPKSGRGAGI